jgi:hypothetical protein
MRTWVTYSHTVRIPRNINARACGRRTDTDKLSCCNVTVNIDVHGFVRVRRPVGDPLRHHSRTHSIVHRGVRSMVPANLADAKRYLTLEIE